MRKLRLTFTDSFSFCETKKETTVNEQQYEQILKGLNKVVHREFKNSINYSWILTKIETN